MKKVILSLSLVCLAPLALNAQGGEVEGLIELLRSDIRAEKVVLLTTAMNLDQKQAESFWPLQREYEGGLARLNDQRLRMIKQYAQQWGTFTNEGAVAILVLKPGRTAQAPQGDLQEDEQGDRRSSSGAFHPDRECGADAPGSTDIRGVPFVGVALCAVRKCASGMSLKGVPS